MTRLSCTLTLFSPFFFLFSPFYLLHFIRGFSILEVSSSHHREIQVLGFDFGLGTVIFFLLFYLHLFSFLFLFFFNFLQ